ncbi:MAG: VOC family protein [Ignavibacterium sp.]|nr:VOC family protein [Ignavibacterium sp.]MDW8375570.1 VOC family protein [Ignavibacteriales bacterium]
MNLKFHHLGIVVESIEQYEKQMIYLEKISEVDDGLQNSKLALYKNFNDSFIELIEPLNPNSTSYNSLKKFGNHLNHICYETTSFEQIEKLMFDKRFIKVFGPSPAKLFNDRNVVFYINRFGQLLEFLI